MWHFAASSLCNHQMKKNKPNNIILRCLQTYGSLVYGKRESYKNLLTVKIITQVDSAGETSNVLVFIMLCAWFFFSRTRFSLSDLYKPNNFLTGNFCLVGTLRRSLFEFIKHVSELLR